MLSEKALKAAVRQLEKAFPMRRHDVDEATYCDWQDMNRITAKVSITAYLTAITEEGYVIVPREPTEGMCQAYFNARDNTWPNQRELAKQQGEGWLSMPAWIWAAMISKAEQGEG